MPKLRKLMRGFSIFLEHDKETWLGAEHDIIYGPPADDIHLSDTEKRWLEEDGWFIDDDCWAAYV